MVLEDVIRQERRLSANEALEAAARAIERLTAGRDPWISGEVLALHNAIAACAAVVRREKRLTN